MRIEVQDKNPCAWLEATFAGTRTSAAAPADQRAADFPALPTRVDGRLKGAVDIVRGLNLSAVLDMNVYGNVDGEEGCVMHLQLNQRFSEIKIWTGTELERRRTALRAVDGAFSDLCAGRLPEALRILAETCAKETDVRWRKGLENLLAATDLLRRFLPSSHTSGEEVSMLDEHLSCDQFFERAQRAEGRLSWAAAVRVYVRFAEQFPDDNRAAAALACAARLLEDRLLDPEHAAELRRRLVDLYQATITAETISESDDTPGPSRADALRWYRLAGAHARAGMSADAVTCYERFLAAASEDVPTCLKALARFRRARLLETLEKPDAARRAYQEFVEWSTDDDYARQLQERARTRTAQLQHDSPVAADDEQKR